MVWKVYLNSFSSPEVVEFCILLHLAFHSPPHPLPIPLPLLTSIVAHAYLYCFPDTKVFINIPLTNFDVYPLTHGCYSLPFILLPVQCPAAERQYIQCLLR